MKWPKSRTRGIESCACRAIQARGVGIALFETDESDVIIAHDFMLPLPKLDSKGMRIVIN